MNTSNYLRGATAFASFMTAACLLASCGGPKGVTPPPKLEATAFVAQVNTDLVELAKEGNAAGWTLSSSARSAESVSPALSSEATDWTENTDQKKV